MKNKGKKILFAAGVVFGFAAAVAYSAGAYTWQTVGGATGKFYNGVNALDAVYDLGKVGIGTTTPAFDLHVEGTTNLGGDVYYEGDRVNIGGKWTDGSTTTQAVYNGGFVGVGTSNPQELLEISNSGSQNSATLSTIDGDNSLQLISDLGAGGYTSLSQSGDQGLIFSNDGNPAASSGGLVIAPHNSSGFGVRIMENGNVGLGLAVPTVELDVDGTVRAVEFIYTSDEREKENIVDLANYAKILNISPKRYDWVKKDGKDSDYGDIGVIAQDVEKYFPEFVSEDDKGIKSVNYPKLIVPVLGVLKDQQKQIEDLQSQINSLK